jgi:hypothetical protein
MRFCMNYICLIRTFLCWCCLVYNPQIYLTARSLTSKLRVELSDQLLPLGTARLDSLGGDSRNLLLSVGQVCGDRELPLSTNGHTVQTLVPTLDDFTSTEDEGEWRAGGVGVELLAVGQFTNVSGDQLMYEIS